MFNLKYCIFSVFFLLSVYSQTEDIFYSAFDTVQVSDYGAKAPPGISTPSLTSTKLTTENTDTNVYFEQTPLGVHSQWIYLKDEKEQTISFSSSHWVRFSFKFKADCLRSEAIININALPWNYIVAVLNGHVVASGWEVIEMSSKDCGNCSNDSNCSCLNCGQNNVQVYVLVACQSCSAALCARITQDKSNCFCENKALSFYNSNTCACECTSNNRTCSDSLQWHGYPTCDCSCDRKSCPFNQIFNNRTCKCQCHLSTCPPRYQVNPIYCRCVSVIVSPFPKICTGDRYLCPNGMLRDENCLCLPFNLKLLSQAGCSETICSPPLSWNKQSCKCT